MGSSCDRPNEAQSLDQLISARELLQEALARLDDSQAPAHIGAHVDHAIVSLDRLISEPPPK